MHRRDVIRILKGQAPEARALGVRAMHLFGSTARGEAKPDSDVHLFVDYDRDRFGLIELARLQRQLSDALGRPTDVGTRDGLHPLLRDAIERDAVRVFWRTHRRGPARDPRMA